MLAPPVLPLARSRGQLFDDLVLDAVEELEGQWREELDGVEFAVEDVPADDAERDLGRDAVIDRGIALGRLYRDGVARLPAPTVVVYRRPIEARTVDADDRAELVFAVLAELIAELRGRDVEDLDH
jgi:predicted Zn-dependent protease with MMP-like domain